MVSLSRISQPVKTSITIIGFFISLVIFHYATLDRISAETEKKIANHKESSLEFSHPSTQITLEKILDRMDNLTINQILMGTKIDSLRIEMNAQMKRLN